MIVNDEEADDDDEGPYSWIKNQLLPQLDGRSLTQEKLLLTLRWTRSIRIRTFMNNPQMTFMQDEGHVSRSGGHRNAHNSKFPEPENNWENTYATTYKVPAENKLQKKTYDIGSFIKWFCRRTGKKKLYKADLEGLSSFEYNKGMETKKWSEDDRRRSKDFITAIEKRLQIRRIFRSLESFVGGRIRDIDYRLIKQNNVTTSSLQ
ncbi:hypothetical protein Tco_1069665 [Tanacetum coccineum]|uniref:Uncharacterized protein n=1 Tax=Tanacetum coccineum TaxID=301880 RepID=A0ABQ5HJ66_9ASTR